MVNGDGCSPIMLSNNSASQKADYSRYNEDQYFIDPSNDPNALDSGPYGDGDGDGIGVGVLGPSGQTYSTITVSFAGGDYQSASSTGPPADNGELLIPIQATLQDGSSMLTGQIGMETGTQEQNGNYPCVDLGGVAGT